MGGTHSKLSQLRVIGPKRNTLNIMRWTIIIALISSYSLVTGELQSCQSGTKHTGICVKSDYDVSKPPGKPTEIDLTVDIQEIIAIDEKKQTITLLVQFHLVWIDPRLFGTNMDDSADSAVSAVNVVQLQHDIWVPEAYFSNSIEIKKLKGIKGDSWKRIYFVRHLNQELSLSYFGSNYENQSFFLLTDTIRSEFTCKMNFEKYPFDRQNCTMDFQLFDHEILEAVFYRIILGIKSKMLEKESSIAVVKTSGLPFKVTVGAMKPEVMDVYHWKYSQARVEFHLTRKIERLNTLLISYYVPSAAFTVLSQFSFFIKPEIVSTISI